MHILWSYEDSFLVTSALILSLQYEPKEIFYYQFLFYEVFPILICLVADLRKQITCDISCISSIMLFPFVLQDDVHMKANVMHLFPYYACFFPG